MESSCNMSNEVWKEKAACSGMDPAIFFGGTIDDGGEVVRRPHVASYERQAKLVCEGCPVRMECLWFAISGREGFGIWGGATERERRRIVRTWGRNSNFRPDDADVANVIASAIS
jgi:WhiB family redox-sensing transcriptional regulator